MRKSKCKSGVFSFILAAIFVATSLLIWRLIEDNGVAYASERHAIILLENDIVYFYGPIQDQVFMDARMPLGIILGQPSVSYMDGTYQPAPVLGDVIYPHDEEKYQQVPEGWLHEDGTPHIRIDRTVREADVVESAKVQLMPSTNVLPLGFVRVPAASRSAMNIPGFQAVFVSRRFAITLQLVVAALAFLRGLYIIVRNRRLRRQYRCLCCTYLLAGLQSDACPECGLVFARTGGSAP